MYNKNKKFCKGHRQRILKHLLKNGMNDLSILEIIELCLFFSIPRKDVKTSAYLLIEKYKYLYLILGASKEEILSISGLGYQTYLFFQLLLKIISYINEEKIYEKESFFSLEDIINYFKWKMCYLTHEEVRILYFNSKNKLIKDELQFTGTINCVNIYPREIIKRCLQIGAVSIVICHNHPSGDVNPSKEDINLTLCLKKITDLLDITIHDHIIIGQNNYFSMKKHNIF